MSFKHLRITTIVIETIVYSSAIGAASGFARMTSPGPGPNEFLLRWEPSKLVLPIMIWSLVGAVVGVVRARRWLAAYWKTIRDMGDKGDDP